MSFYQLFIANFKILYRNWRGLFWNLLLPIALYIGLSMLKITRFGTATINYSNYLLPGVIAMTLMQTGIYSLSYWLIDLKQRGVLRRFLVTPLSRFELMGSLILTRVIMMFVQVAILTFIGVNFFGVNVQGSMLAIIFLAALGSAIFLSIGFLVSVISNTYDEAAPITTVVNLLFTFLGNVFFPSSVFPKVLRGLSSILPITYLAEGMRKNFMTNSSFYDSVGAVFALLIWMIAVLAATYYVFRLKKEEML